MDDFDETSVLREFVSIFENGERIRALRQHKGIEQAEFWGKIGVSMKAAERYEKCNNEIPLPVQAALFLKHGAEKDVISLMKWFRS